MNNTPQITVIPATINLYQNTPLNDPTVTRRVAAYARVSTDKEEQENSFEAQVDYYTNYINENPEWELTEFYTDEGITTAIDLIPVLTETGGGFRKAAYHGVSSETTNDADTTWSANLIQITDKLPRGYEIIDCCFADMWDRAKYCHRKYGADENGYIQTDNNGRLYEAAAYNILSRRGSNGNVMVEDAGKKLQYIFKVHSVR